MNQRQRIIESTNKGFGSLGDATPPPGQRHEIEDRLIQVLEDCLFGPNSSVRSVNLKPFREFLRTHGRAAGWNPDNVSLCLHSDDDCEATLHFTIASLKRLQHRAEWSVNWLLQHGLPHAMIPDGQQYLGR